MPRYDARIARFRLPDDEPDRFRWKPVCAICGKPIEVSYTTRIVERFTVTEFCDFDYYNKPTGRPDDTFFPESIDQIEKDYEIDFHLACTADPTHITGWRAEEVMGEVLITFVERQDL